MKKYFLLIIIGLSISCINNTKQTSEIDFSDTISKQNNSNTQDSKVVYIAIASMTSPKETFTYYSDLINYISEKAGFPIYIKQKKTYEEVNELLENSEVDFAFICSGAFIDKYDMGKTKLLVAPKIHNKTNYNAYIIANKESNVESFEDFKNKSFAYTDPLSNTGRLFPLKKIKLLNDNEPTFFNKTIYTYGHDISIQMVNRGIIDGASIHSCIYDYIATHYPEKVENIDIISISETFGMPPIVVPTTLSNESYEKYKQIFMEIHKDSIGKKILNNLMIDEFVEVNDSIYKTVFELKKYIEDENKK